jgi:hypothetical protein
MFRLANAEKLKFNWRVCIQCPVCKRNIECLIVKSRVCEFLNNADWFDDTTVMCDTCKVNSPIRLTVQRYFEI